MMSGETSRRFARREFMQAGLLAAAAGGLAGISGCAGNGGQNLGERKLPFTQGTEPPKTRVPPNACDCHHHVYDNRFPVAAGVATVPPNATVEDYRLLQRRLGTNRNVVVTPSAYGTDNSCILDALAKFGKNARGVGVVDTSVTDAELKRLYDRGIRGLRINVPPHIATTIEMVEPLSKRAQQFDMHVQIHMLADDIVKIQDVLGRLPSRLVIDHFGRIPQPAGTAHPAFAVIRGLLDKGRTWVKLSSEYQDSKVGAPSYADVGRLARAYVQLAPERMLWGTDWPHPGFPNSPDDAAMFDLLAQWTPDEKTRERILVGNPEALYGFAAG
jgi:D-galactarolactone isomerase